MLPSSIFGVYDFQLNATGDLFVEYMESALGAQMRSQVLPLGGGSPFEVGGTPNAWISAGEPGHADQERFYASSGGTGGVAFEGAFRIVSRTGPTFSEAQQTIALPGVEGYGGLHRLSDGIYMINGTTRSLLKVIADGALVASPAPVALTAVDAIPSTVAVAPVGGRWVFVARDGATFKFVRHDGVTQQDIPLEAGLDVRSYTVSAAGAIEFLAIRTATAEKLRGTVAAGATAVITSAAGLLDPARVVAFTRIN
jgi:hypothetical protein